MIILTPGDLGALIVSVASELVAASTEFGGAIEQTALSNLLSAWSAALERDSGSIARPQTPWLTQCHTAQEIQRSHQWLREAIFARLPKDGVLSPRASILFARLFDDSIAAATEHLIDRFVGSEVADHGLLSESNRLQQQALELALQDAPIEAVLEVLAKLVERQSGSDLQASILLVDEEGRRLLHGAAPSLPAAYNQAIDGIEIGPLAGSCGTAAYQRARVIVEDIEHDVRWARYKDLALAHGLRACWSVPILTHQGKLLGTFALYSRTVHQPTARENQIVDIAAGTTALIIGRQREIRERLKNAEALREREAELKFTLASAKLGTWSIDFTRDGFVAMSAEAAAMLGLRSDSCDFGSIIEECVHPDDREQAKRVLQDAIASGQSYRDTYRVRWPNGEIRWLEVRGRARYGAAGGLATLSGILIDITEPKRVEENLGTNKRMLELAASCGRVGFWHVDITRGSFEPDEKMANDWGIDSANFVRTIDAGLAIIHPDDRHLVISGMEKALADNRFYDKEYRIILPSGVERWIHAQGEYHSDENGQRTLFSGVSLDITDKKLGQLAEQRIADTIAKEREKFEQVLEQLTVSTALFQGPNHVFSFANSAYLQTFELDKSILGKSLTEVFFDAVEQGSVARLDEIYATGKAIEVHERLFKHQSRSGEIRSQYFDVTYAAKYDAAQRIDGVLVTAINVTDRVLLRQASDNADALLSAERFKLNQIVQNSPAAMATWVGPNLIFERVNPEYAKIFPGRQLVGKELLQACPELVGQGFDEILRHVLASGEPYVGSQVSAQIAQTPGGPLEERFYDFTYLRINDQNGNPYCVHDFALDVTDRVLAQRRAEEATAKLREAEDLLSRAIEVANIGFFNWDLSNNTILFSAQMQRDWGVEGNPTLQAVISYIHPDDRQRVNRAVQKTIAEGGKSLEEYRVRRPTDGKTVWIEAQGGLAPDRQGKMTRFIGTSLDITQRKNAEERLRTASIEAHNASSAKSAFLANMSHEIRTPLGAIMGFAELLRKPELLPPNRANFVGVIERNSQHLLRIVDDILDLSKVEAGKMIFENIEFSLPEILSDFSSLMGLRARDKGIDFALRIGTPLPALVVSDPTRLRQILHNIVGNAVKFTEHGSVELRVHYADPLLEFEVRDTGRGISPEQTQRLFQAFAQADESTTRNFGGTGLGLVLTKRLTLAMGGDCYLKESTPSVGSTFIAQIKVGVPPGNSFFNEQALGLSTDAQTAATPERMLTDLHILVVDDSPDNRTLLSVMLEDAGASVESASDGQLGVEMALAKHFDAVLMDIQMPRMDGYQAIAQLHDQGYTTPVIAITAHAMVEERERAQGKGFADFVTKPIQREALIHILDRLRRTASPVVAPPAAPAPTAARSVLIVEDGDGIELMEVVLMSLGMTVRCARSGSQALAAIREGFAPELVLLDLTLPDMSGEQVLAEVRRAPACKDARVVVISGWENTQQRAREMGADGYLRKPINLTDLEALATAPVV